MANLSPKSNLHLHYLQQTKLGVDCGAKNYIKAGKQTANSIRSYSVSIMQVWLSIGLQSLYTRRQLIIQAPCPACYVTTE